MSLSLAEQHLLLMSLLGTKSLCNLSSLKILFTLRRFGKTLGNDNSSSIAVFNMVIGIYDWITYFIGFFDLEWNDTSISVLF